MEKEKLKKISKKELDKLIEKHLHWLKRNCDEWSDGEQLTLQDVDLSHMDISYANLSSARFSNVDFSNCYLIGTDLSYSNITDCSFSNAYIRNANLNLSSIHDSSFLGADLTYTSVIGSEFYHTDLTNIQTLHDDFFWNYVSFFDVTIDNMSLSNISFRCPDTGSFIGWKIAFETFVHKVEPVLIKLEIPADAKRSSAIGNKCRCDKAKVLDIYELDTERSIDIEAISGFNRAFTYRIGEMVSVDDFDEDRWNECSTGIHFFINKKDAINYKMF